MTGRLRGLKDLVQDAVEHGSRAVERIHRTHLRVPYEVVGKVPGLETPAKAIHTVHDGSVAVVYGTVRLVNRAVGAALGVALAAADLARGEKPTDAEAAPVPDEPSFKSPTPPPSKEG